MLRSCVAKKSLLRIVSGNITLIRPVPTDKKSWEDLSVLFLCNN